MRQTGDRCRLPGQHPERDLTVWANLYFHARYFRMSVQDARAAADAWLEGFRLTAKAAVKVDALSGGMARRLMLARATLHRPAVVFLDEPTAGLDPQSRLALWETSKGCTPAGRRCSSHALHGRRAERFCERVAIMDHGWLLR
ncbi:MAG: ATP-binding cassette domain-containing protein [Actinobacteria bacterium]|nr:ATP-binding cassette domain-containing protein [Actinomycetota bacterium]